MSIIALLFCLAANTHAQNFNIPSAFQDLAPAPKNTLLINRYTHAILGLPFDAFNQSYTVLSRINRQIEEYCFTQSDVWGCLDAKAGSLEVVLQAILKERNQRVKAHNNRVRAVQAETQRLNRQRLALQNQTRATRRQTRQLQQELKSLFGVR